MEPIDYARLFRRRWIVVAVGLLCGLPLGLLTAPDSSDDPRAFLASHTLVRIETASQSPAPLHVVSLLVKNGDVPERVAAATSGAETARQLASRVDLEVHDEIYALRIMATGPTRRSAAGLANAFGSETLVQLRIEAEAERAKAIADAQNSVDALMADIAMLDRRIARAQARNSDPSLLLVERDVKLNRYANALEFREGIARLESPEAGYRSLELADPEGASRREPGVLDLRGPALLYVIALGLAGLLVGLAATLVLERVDPRITTREAAERAFGLPVVAEVPYAPRRRGRSHEIHSVTEPSSAFAEAYRSARASTVLMPTRRLTTDGRSVETGAVREPHVLVVTSPSPKDGKSSTIANLAASFAETGRSVLVLEADFTRPQVHRYFDVARSPGFADVLERAEGGIASFASVVKGTEIPHLRVMPAGRVAPSPGRVAAVGRSFVRAARELADVVLIDTAPLLAKNEGVELIPAADTVVLVCRRGRTSIDGAKRTRQLLERLGAPVTGVVLVGSASVDAYGGSYSGYYASTTRKRGRLRRLWQRRRRSHDDAEPAHLAPSEPPESPASTRR